MSGNWKTAVTEPGQCEHAHEGLNARLHAFSPPLPYEEGAQPAAALGGADER